MECPEGSLEPDHIDQSQHIGARALDGELIAWFSNTTRPKFSTYTSRT